MLLGVAGHYVVLLSSLYAESASIISIGFLLTFHKFTLAGPVLPFLRGRGTAPPAALSTQYFDTAVLTQTSFTFITFSNLFQGLVYFLPYFFIPCKYQPAYLHFSPPDLTRSQHTQLHLAYLPSKEQS